jgi:hypothetical protein
MGLVRADTAYVKVKGNTVIAEYFYRHSNKSSNQCFGYYLDVLQLDLLA